MESVQKQQKPALIVMPRYFFEVPDLRSTGCGALKNRAEARPSHPENRKIQVELLFDRDFAGTGDADAFDPQFGGFVVFRKDRHDLQSVFLFGIKLFRY